MNIFLFLCRKAEQKICNGTGHKSQMKNPNRMLLTALANYVIYDSFPLIKTFFSHKAERARAIFHC